MALPADEALMPSGTSIRSSRSCAWRSRTGRDLRSDTRTPAVAGESGLPWIESGVLPLTGRTRHDRCHGPLRRLYRPEGLSGVRPCRPEPGRASGAARRSGSEPDASGDCVRVPPTGTSGRVDKCVTVIEARTRKTSRPEPGAIARGIGGSADGEGNGGPNRRRRLNLLFAVEGSHRLGHLDGDRTRTCG